MATVATTGTLCGRMTEINIRKGPAPLVRVCSLAAALAAGFAWATLCAAIRMAARLSSP